MISDTLPHDLNSTQDAERSLSPIYEHHLIAFLECIIANAKIFTFFNTTHEIDAATDLAFFLSRDEMYYPQSVSLIPALTTPLSIRFSKTKNSNS